MKIVPALARMAFGLNRSVRGDAATTASTAGAIGAAQDRAEVARLLDALDDRDERIGRQRQAPSGRATGSATTATSPSARSPKASFAKTASLVGWTTTPPAAQPVEGGARVGPGQERLADEHLDDLDAGVDRSPDLARAVDQGQPGPVALAPVAQRRRRP